MSRKYYDNETSDEEYGYTPYYSKNAQSKFTKYKNSKMYFLRVLQKWLPERRSTLSKLRLLLREVHDEVLKINKSQATFKELSYNSRTLKRETQSEALQFFSSLGALIGDVASGITSVAEACKVDSYQTRFEEIIDSDSKITKELYNARSQCMTEYHGIEEVIRNPVPKTLTSTIDTIKNTLTLDKHWAVIQKTEDVGQFINAVGNLCDTVFQPEALGAASASLQRYLDNNPAPIEACKSAGKAVYGVISMIDDEKESGKRIVNRDVRSVADYILRMDDKNEIDRLNRVISEEDASQNKLESTIRDTIFTMEKELEEINQLYLQLQSSISNYS